MEVKVKGERLKAKVCFLPFAFRLLYDLQPPAGQPPEGNGELGQLASPATFFLAPLLKSVSYQPPPFNLNPAAEIFFINSGLLQAGQIIKGSALSFCKASCSWPHD